MVIDIENSLAELKNDNDNSGKISKFIYELKATFHPKYYRKYRKIRTRLDRTNDLISAYSMQLSRFINFDNVEKMFENGKCSTESQIISTYRIMWTFVLSTISRLIRISSNDLRYWLTDLPYIHYAYQWAQKDINAITEFIINNDKSGNIVVLSLERNEGVQTFWNGMYKSASLSTPKKKKTTCKKNKLPPALAPENKPHQG